MSEQRIGWPDQGILGHYAVVVSREDCHAWYARIEAGEKPLILGMLPPFPEICLQHVSAQIGMSTRPAPGAGRVWQFLEPRWVN